MKLELLAWNEASSMYLQLFICLLLKRLQIMPIEERKRKEALQGFIKGDFKNYT